MSPIKAWELIKVISGGQTGADQAGLVAAKYLGYETGGFATLGFRTEAGPAPWLGSDFGLIELPVVSYKSRTYKNVRYGDGTILFGHIEADSGSDYTQQLCEAHGKPYLVNPTIELLRNWIVEYQIKILNVAGNRESKTPGIFQSTELLLREGLLPF